MMGARPSIWECAISDASYYFESKAEADLFQREAAKAGFTVRMQSIPVPQTPRDFVGFLERQARRSVEPQPHTKGSTP